MKTYASTQIAQYYIALNQAEARLAKANYFLDEQKLEQLLYETQSYSLYVIGQPLIKEAFLMTSTGPIIPAIRQRYAKLAIKHLVWTSSKAETQQLSKNLRLIEQDTTADNLLVAAYLKRAKLQPLYPQQPTATMPLKQTITNQQLIDACNRSTSINWCDVLADQTDLVSPLVMTV